jgi:hypothetical protein
MAGIHPDFTSSAGSHVAVFTFEEVARLGEREKDAIDFELIFTGVVGNRDDVANLVAMGAKGINDQSGVDGVLHEDLLRIEMRESSASVAAERA